LKREAMTYSFLKYDSWSIHLAIKKDESQTVLLPTKISQVLIDCIDCDISRFRTTKT
ncbi:8427_t:CDS:1, partial [Scutellospora calospora]